MRIISSFHIANIVKKNLFLTILVVIGIVYVTARLSPSSYGAGLSHLQAPNHGLLLGESRPIRSDEWAVHTPNIKISVNNDFQRINKTSPYREDLRSIFCLPLKDPWLVIKPQMWGFMIFPPGIAFSLLHFLYIFFFLFGYYRLLLRLTGQPVLSAVGAFLLFTTGGIQYWWTVLGQAFVFFPWAILPFLSSRERPHDKFRMLLTAVAGIYWAQVWLFTLFYPPVILPLCLIGFVLISAVRIKEGRSIFNALFHSALFALCIALAFVSFRLYLGDTYSSIVNTVYPGQRISSGDGLPFRLFAGNLFPFLNITNHKSLIGLNVCETATVCSALLLPLIFFFDWRRIKIPIKNNIILFALIGIALLMCAWVLIPIPGWMGSLLLWHQVPPERLNLSLGFVLTIMVLLIAARNQWTISWKRLILFCLACSLGWYVSQGLPSIIPYRGDAAIWYVALISAGLALPIKPRTGLLIGASILQMCMFLTFNPLQRSDEIFTPNRKSSIITILDHLQATNPENLLVYPGFLGSMLNGEGYRSLSHTCISPKVDFFRKRMPELDESTLNNLFNRYCHIIPTETLDETSLHYQDAVNVPMYRFQPNRRVSILDDGNIPSTPPSEKGCIDQVFVKDSHIIINGWSLFNGVRSSQVIRIFVDGRTAMKSRLRAASHLRSDVADALDDIRLLQSGFHLEIETDNTDDFIRHRFTIITIDPEFGAVTVFDPGKQRPTGVD